MKYLILILTLFFTILYGVSIHDIQFTNNSGDGTYPSDYQGQTVTTGGIVTGTDFSGGRFYIGTSTGGAWSGLYIYNNQYNVAVGDSIIVTGEIYEYNGFTEISPLYSLQIISSGNNLPQPVEISCWQAGNDEAYESVLVKISDCEVSQVFNQWGDWALTDGTSDVVVSNGFYDLQSDNIPLFEGYQFDQAVGIISYFYDTFRFNIRSFYDLQSEPGEYIITIPDNIFFVNDGISIPINIIFFGLDQDLDSYSFTLDYNSDVLTFNSLDVDETLSENGTISYDEPIEGSLEVEFQGDITFSDLDILLELCFDVSSSGYAEFQIPQFSIEENEIGYISIGNVSILSGEGGFGDTLTVIQRPILNIPAIVEPEETFTIQCLAAESVTNWFANLKYNTVEIPLEIDDAFYDHDLERWFIDVIAPIPDFFELFDLEVGADGIETDISENAVQLISAYKDNYSFIHVTDTHLPNHLFYPDPEALTDTTEVEDLREVIRDINLINPEFVLLTGDLINEGEMEEFQNRRVYTIAQRLLAEFEVPVYLIAGNHDIGGWQDSPPSQGSARRYWWKFFGWNWLQNPPDNDFYYTQNYSFDYNGIYFLGMESYDNYDDYMYNIYGDLSFTDNQIVWLEDELDNINPDFGKVLFYHYDFSDQIFLQNLDVDMALYGHIHSNSGSVDSYPYNLATEAVCDGQRAYRIINVDNGVLDPQETVYAGYSGEELTIEYFPSNDGTSDSVTVQIVNQHDLAFPDSRVKLKMPAGDYDYIVENGVVEQISYESDFNVVYISTYLPANSNIEVIVQAESLIGSNENEMPAIDLNLHVYPNPVNLSNPNRSTEVVFSFNSTETLDAEDIELYIYNLKGQLVNDGEALKSSLSRAKNGYSIVWDGRGKSGKKLGSGLYFCRLKCGNQEDTAKVVILK